jgi:hypothetical protein
LRGYTARQRYKRDAAVIVVGLAGVFLAATLVVAGSDFDWAIIRLFAWLWTIPLAWAAWVLLSRKESIRVDLERRVIVSGKDRREAPVERLYPLAVTQPIGRTRAGTRIRLPRFQVVAEGWSGYVLYESPSRKRADAKLVEIERRLSGTS